MEKERVKTTLYGLMNDMISLIIFFYHNILLLLSITYFEMSHMNVSLRWKNFDFDSISCLFDCDDPPLQYGKAYCCVFSYMFPFPLGITVHNITFYTVLNC
jgi:hypothetical protein